MSKKSTKYLYNNLNVGDKITVTKFVTCDAYSPFRDFQFRFSHGMVGIVGAIHVPCVTYYSGMFKNEFVCINFHPTKEMCEFAAAKGWKLSEDNFLRCAAGYNEIELFEK